MDSLANLQEEAIVVDTLRRVGSYDAFMMVKHAIIVQCDMYVNELRKLDAEGKVGGPVAEGVARIQQQFRMIYDTALQKALAEAAVIEARPYVESFMRAGLPAPPSSSSSDTVDGDHAPASTNAMGLMGGSSTSGGGGGGDGLMDTPMKAEPASPASMSIASSTVPAVATPASSLSSAAVSSSMALRPRSVSSDHSSTAGGSDDDNNSNNNEDDDDYDGDDASTSSKKKNNKNSRGKVKSESRNTNNDNTNKGSGNGGNGRSESKKSNGGYRPSSRSASSSASSSSSTIISNNATTVSRVQPAAATSVASNVSSKATSAVSSRPSSASSSSRSDAPPHHRRRDNFSTEQKRILTDWCKAHEQHPYPSVSEKQELAAKVGKDFDKISNWFINYRTRHWKHKAKAKKAAAAAGMTTASAAAASRAAAAIQQQRAVSVESPTPGEIDMDEDDGGDSERSASPRGPNSNAPARPTRVSTDFGTPKSSSTASPLSAVSDAVSPLPSSATSGGSSVSSQQFQNLSLSGRLLESAFAGVANHPSLRYHHPHTPQAATTTLSSHPLIALQQQLQQQQLLNAVNNHHTPSLSSLSSGGSSVTSSLVSPSSDLVDAAPPDVSPPFVTTHSSGTSSNSGLPNASPMSHHHINLAPTSAYDSPLSSPDPLMIPHLRPMHVNVNAPSTTPSASSSSNGTSGTSFSPDVARINPPSRADSRMEASSTGAAPMSTGGLTPNGITNSTNNNHSNNNNGYTVYSRPSSSSLPLSPSSAIAMYGAGLGAMSVSNTPIASPHLPSSSAIAAPSSTTPSMHHHTIAATSATPTMTYNHHHNMIPSHGGNHSASSTPKSPHDILLSASGGASSIGMLSTPKSPHDILLSASGGAPSIGMLYGTRPSTPGSMIGMRGVSPMPPSAPGSTNTQYSYLRSVSPLPMHSFPPTYSPVDGHGGVRSLTPSPSLTAARTLPILSGPSTPTEPTGVNGAWASTPQSDDGTSTPGGTMSGFIGFPTGTTPPLYTTTISSMSSNSTNITGGMGIAVGSGYQGPQPATPSNASGAPSTTQGTSNNTNGGGNGTSGTDGSGPVLRSAFMFSPWVTNPRHIDII